MTCERGTRSVVGGLSRGLYLQRVVLSQIVERCMYVYRIEEETGNWARGLRMAGWLAGRPALEEAVRWVMWCVNIYLTSLLVDKGLLVAAAPVSSPNYKTIA